VKLSMTCARRASGGRPGIGRVPRWEEEAVVPSGSWTEIASEPAGRMVANAAASAVVRKCALAPVSALSRRM
jgi:hypothetical protein